MRDTLVHRGKNRVMDSFPFLYQKNKKLRGENNVGSRMVLQDTSHVQAETKKGVDFVVLIKGFAPGGKGAKKTEKTGGKKKKGCAQHFRRWERSKKGGERREGGGKENVTNQITL